MGTTSTSQLARFVIRGGLAYVAVGVGCILVGLAVLGRQDQAPALELAPCPCPPNRGAAHLEGCAADPDPAASGAWYGSRCPDCQRE